MNYIDRLHLDNDNFIETLDRELAVPPGRGTTRVAKVAKALQNTVLKKYMLGIVSWVDKEGVLWIWNGKCWDYSGPHDSTA